MLTDAMLSEAAAEAERFLLSIVPEDGESHVFSKRFERKIQKLIRRTNHPIRYQIMRTAAAVLLAIATLFGAVMAVSPEARAAVVGWVKSAFHEFFEYSNKDSYAGNNMGNDANNGDINNNNTNNDSANNDDSPQSSEPVKYEYHLSSIPDGYRELKAIDKLDGKLYLFVNDSGQILQFTYTYGVQNSSMFAEAQKYEQYSSLVNGLPADVYIATSEAEASGIIWQNSDGNVLFQIAAFADKDELIAIAETVTETKS